MTEIHRNYGIPRTPGEYQRRRGRVVVTCPECLAGIEIEPDRITKGTTHFEVEGDVACSCGWSVEDVTLERRTRDEEG